MRSRPDVAVLSEQDVVPVLHTAETAVKHTHRANKQPNKSRYVYVCACVRVFNLLFSEEAGDAKLCVFLFVFQQLSHSIAKIKQHAAFGCEKLTHSSVISVGFNKNHTQNVSMNNEAKPK